MSELNAAIVIAVLSAVPVGAQNLLVNPGFDVANQLAGWSCSSDHGVASWISDDRQGSPTSGAMQHFVTATSNNQTVSCNQCVAVDELLAYRLSAWHYWPDDPDVTQAGTLRLYFSFFSDPACSTYVGPGTVKVGYHPAPDTWYLAIANEAIAPAGSQSARVFLVTWQNLADDWVRARIDDVDFRTTTLFRDGFESGDVGMWSSWVP